MVNPILSIYFFIHVRETTGCVGQIPPPNYKGPIPQLSPARADTGLEDAERTGFEPAKLLHPTVFKTARQPTVHLSLFYKERVEVIETSSSAWKADALTVVLHSQSVWVGVSSHTRLKGFGFFYNLP